MHAVISLLLRPHSIILASCKPGRKPGLQSGFRQVRACLRHPFDQLSTFFVEKLVANRSSFAMVRARARQTECRKTRLKQVRSWLSTCFRPAWNYSQYHPRISHWSGVFRCWCCRPQSSHTWESFKYADDIRISSFHAAVNDSSRLAELQNIRSVGPGQQSQDTSGQIC